MAKRSEPGQGAQCFIYVMGPAEEYADDIISVHGETAIRGGSTGEDFADTRWPVVVKVKAQVTDNQLARHLRDLADSIDQYGGHQEIEFIRLVMD